MDGLLGTKAEAQIHISSHHNNTYRPHLKTIDISEKENGSGWQNAAWSLICVDQLCWAALSSTGNFGWNLASSHQHLKRDKAIVFFYVMLHSSICESKDCWQIISINSIQIDKVMGKPHRIPSTEKALWWEQAGTQTGEVCLSPKSMCLGNPSKLCTILI